MKDEPIAVISAVKYSEDFGFLGFYIVKPEYRGQGYGLQIWNAALDYLKGSNMGLDGVVDQQDNDKKSGFQLACRNVRHEGRGDRGGDDFIAPDPEVIDPKVIDLDDFPFEEVDLYDCAFFPADRAALH